MRRAYCIRSVAVASGFAFRQVCGEGKLTIVVATQVFATSLLWVVPRRDVDHRIMKTPVAGDDAGFGHRDGIAPGIGNLPTCFFDEKTSRSKIPWRELVFEEATKLSATDLAQVQ